MSRFEADATKKRTRRAAVRRDTEKKDLRRAWKKARRARLRAEARIEAAGFNDAEHYLRDGSAYCQCGSVADHNRRLDDLVKA